MTMLRLCAAVVALVIVGVSLIYAVFEPMELACRNAGGLLPGANVPASLNAPICTRYDALAVTLVLILGGTITLFGTMAIPGAQTADGSFSEQRIRLAIAMTVLVVYLVYFGMAVVWGGNLTPMVGTLTNLVMVVIPFYFGASAAVQWAEKAGTKQKTADTSTS